jgi:hypothetical protein
MSGAVLSPADMFNPVFRLWFVSGRFCKPRSSLPKPASSGYATSSRPTNANLLSGTSRPGSGGKHQAGRCRGRIGPALNGRLGGRFHQLDESAGSMHPGVLP